jgi:hypothetical protein
MNCHAGSTQQSHKFMALVRNSGNASSDGKLAFAIVDVVRLAITDVPLRITVITAIVAVILS